MRSTKMTGEKAWEKGSRRLRKKSSANNDQAENDAAMAAAHGRSTIG
jgi:hypothetical protein